MIELILLTLATVLAAIAAVFALMNFFRRGASSQIDHATLDALERLLRTESDVIRRAGDDQSRGVRQELSDALKNFQDSIVTTFKTLNEFINSQIRDFSGRLDTGIKSIDDKIDGMANKLNEDLTQMEIEAHKNRDSLRTLVEQKLDDAVAKQALAAKDLREELGRDSRRLEERVTDTLGQTSDQQKERLEQVSGAVTNLSEKLAQAQESLRAGIEQKQDSHRRDVEGRLDEALARQSIEAKNSREEMNSSFELLGNRVRDALAQAGDLQKERLESATRALNELGEKMVQAQESLKAAVESKLHLLQQENATKMDDVVSKQEAGAKEFRDEMEGSFQRLGGRVGDSLQQTSEHQRERLEGNAKALTALSDKLSIAQETLRTAVEARLDSIRQESATKLDELRQTVDKRLQTTLETRLDESFTRVVDQLNQMHQGIGEMKTLAASVGDLKHMLTNPKIRGTFGEVQLSLLLEEFLAPDQYVRNAQVRQESGERVEFAIKMPGKEGIQVLLPVDAKFPIEDYHKLLEASEAGDPELVALFRKQLQNRIKGCAKDIRDKYVNPPATTDFAVLFLPAESLYAEVLREPGLMEFLQREYRVTLAGPTTLAAYLNALQMGFRTLAIEKRSSEVWQVLGAVRAEFGKYNGVVQSLATQLNRAVGSVDKLGTRTRVMARTLKAVESDVDDISAQKLLGLAPEDLALEADDESAPISDTISSEIVVPEDFVLPDDTSPKA